MENSTEQPMTHIRKLCDEIGHRPAGSPENRAAAEYIAGVFDQTGLAVRWQPFDCLAWDHEETLLEVAGKRFSQHGQADSAPQINANWRSVPCDVTAPVIALDSLIALKKADLHGKVALLYGELTQDELSNRDSFVYYPDHHRKINMLIDQKKPLAVITVCPLLQSMRHVIKDPDMQIPSATVSPQVGLEILRSLENPIHLKIVSNRQSGQSWNILGTRVGRQPERIVLSAHYDPVWGTQGAYDNASGVGVLLSLADALATVDLPFGLEFYASSGEEFGGQGTDVYQDQYGLRSFPFHFDQPIGEQSPIWKPILANLNTDGVGLALGKNNVTTIAASKAISEEIKLMCKNEFPGFDYVNPWPASDHYTFYSHGVPSVAFGCHPGMSTHHHQPVDTIQWLSAEKLAEVVAFEFKIVQMIAAQPSDWTR